MNTILKDEAFTKFKNLEITAQQAAQYARLPMNKFQEEYTQWSRDVQTIKRARARLRNLPHHIKTRCR